MALLDRIHGGYIHQRRVAILRSHLLDLLPKAGQVLDVGCGDGLLASLIRQKNQRLNISGIDVLVRPGTAIPVREFDGRSIPFGDGSFDAILLVDVLHHTLDPMILLREAARACRGCILIKDHTMDGWMAEPTLRMMDRVGNCRYNVVLPHTYWPRQRWMDAFAQLNLRVDAWLDDLGLYPLPLDWLFGRSLHFVARLKPPSCRTWRLI
jgi:SAM-dependent methyltransferase